MAKKLYALTEQQHSVVIGALAYYATVLEDHGRSVEFATLHRAWDSLLRPIGGVR